MPTAPHGVLGRDAELFEVKRFLVTIRSAPSALVLAGSAGIGKTAIWQYALGLARAAGVEVLSCRPAEAETSLTLSGLIDLLDGVPDRVGAALAAPQRRALEVALLHRDADGPDLDRRTLGVAALSAVRVLARQRPVLLAVDDVQWLDEPSTHVLNYLVRRLRDEPVGVLLAVRSDTTPELLAQLGESLPGQHSTLLRLGQLDLPALRRLLLRRRGVEFARPTLQRIHRATGGNPLYALEMARTLVPSGTDLALGDPEPVPGSLADLLEHRVRALPEPVRDALLHAALLAHPTVATVRTAIGAQRGQLSGLTPAEEAGIIEITDGRIRFTHPLLASAVCAAASAERRQRVHRRLAGVVDDAEERARHLALAEDGPDPRVAALLEEGARSARRRGAPGTAAELWTLARRRTPTEDVTNLHRRAVALGECLFAAGDTGQASEVLRATVPELPPGPVRSRALLNLAEIVFYEGSTVEASELCQQALVGAETDPVLAAEVHLHRAWFATHDASVCLDSAQAAVDLLERPGVHAEPELRSCAFAVAANYRLTNGRGIATDYLEQARRLLPATGPRHWAGNPARQALGAWAKHFDPVRAREFFQGEHRRASELGDEPGVGHALMHLAELDCWLGDWPRARREALRSVDAIELTGQRRWLGFGLYARGLVQAHLGEVDEAGAAAREGLALAERGDDPYVATLLCQVLGFLGLSTGDLESADRHLSRAAALVDRMKIKDPARHMFQGDQIETAAALGLSGQARQLLARLRARAEVAPRAWLLVVADRSEAVVRAAEGEQQAAARAAERALRSCAELPMPFERARTLLVYGRILRARKLKAPARDALSQAGQLFDQLGAPLWSARAGAELDRCGQRQATAGELTPTERRVSDLVAAGLTNTEVGARMFISAKTVEANLTRIYRKLGVRNRRDLVKLGGTRR
ncbi:AAA family ATPase [Micromonosporaceae bacterium B7E4]